jgi:hypothetical protein
MILVHHRVHHIHHSNACTSKFGRVSVVGKIVTVKIGKDKRARIKRKQDDVNYLVTWYTSFGESTLASYRPCNGGEDDGKSARIGERKDKGITLGKLILSNFKLL